MSNGQKIVTPVQRPAALSAGLNPAVDHGKSLIKAWDGACSVTV